MFPAFLILVCSFNNLFAQVKMNAGKIKFESTYPERKEENSSRAAAFLSPEEKTIYFKNGNTRTEIQTPLGRMISIYLAKTGETLTYSDKSNQTFAMKTTKADIDNLKTEMGVRKPNVRLTNETKKIAGINCMKAVVTYANQQPYDVWYTTELDAHNSSDTGIDGVEGFLMEFTTNGKKGVTHTVCTSVEKMEVQDAMFMLPPGYTTKTVNEIRNSTEMH